MDILNAAYDIFELFVTTPIFRRVILFVFCFVLLIGVCNIIRSLVRV